MDYEVINKFKDEDGHVYEVGKPYPLSGKATKKRLTELSEIHPKYKVAFIEEIEQSESEEEKLEREAVEAKLKAKEDEKKKEKVSPVNKDKKKE